MSELDLVMAQGHRCDFVLVIKISVKPRPILQSQQIGAPSNDEFPSLQVQETMYVPIPNRLLSLFLNRKDPGCLLLAPSDNEAQLLPEPRKKFPAN